MGTTNRFIRQNWGLILLVSAILACDSSGTISCIETLNHRSGDAGTDGSVNSDGGTNDDAGTDMSLHDGATDLARDF